MAVIDVVLEHIDDNPYNPRKYYPPAKVKEMAQSLREIGLRQTPEARHVDGRVQLAYGHMRKRGYLANQKAAPEQWKTMPLDVKEISDQDMFHFAMEENLRRTDITPIETARCISAFSEMFPEVTEKDLGQKHSMTEANVSNMKRVLRLPAKLLEKIDNGVISFTQGRELLTLEGLEEAGNLMDSALYGIRTGNKSYGHANTVEGLQASIHEVIRGQYPPIDKEDEGYRWTLLFDTRAPGSSCLDCEKMIRTHPTKSGTAHFCIDPECWNRHDKEHRDKAAAGAKAKIEAEVISRAAQVIEEEKPAAAVTDRTPAQAEDQIKHLKEATEAADQEFAAISQEKSQYTLEKRGPSWIALDSQGVVIAIERDEETVAAAALFYYTPVTTEINPSGYVLNHTYRFVEKPESRKLEYFDVTAQDLATASEALGVDPENIELVKVWKSSGKAGTSGSVSAGWSKCTEQLEDKAAEVEEKATGVTPDDLIATELGKRIAAAPAPVHQEIPEDILAMAREKAGTRAEVLDLKDICSGGQFYRQVNQGYAILDDEIRHIVLPEECLESCTKGFHYAFDSTAKGEQREIHICSDIKCLAQKKSAFTRAKNSAGQARKKAEVKALKEAIAQTTTLDRPRIKLILLAQMDGLHARKSYYYGEESGTKKPEKWLWDKLSAGTPENERTKEKLFKVIDKLTDEELARLVVDFMFFYLVDHGDIGTYQIKAEEPLKWLGVEIENVTA